MPFDGVDEGVLAREKLACYLESLPPENFDMNNWICGTTACIAGHAAIQAGWTGTDSVDCFNIERDGVLGLAGEEARKLLGLTAEQSGKLFTPWGEDNIRPFFNPTKEQAAQALRNITAHGAPRWDLTGLRGGFTPFPASAGGEC